jgi:16S rRNA (guanine1516-N2)-methyltransferase
MTDRVLPIGYESEALFSRAACLASDYQGIIDNTTLPRLSVTDDKLVLLSQQFSPLFVDFNSVSLLKRSATGKQQGLIRACKPRKGMRVVDATAGWGRDSALLVRSGADVLMLERQAMMVALLSDGLRRYVRSESDGLLSLCHMDAKQYLQSLEKGDYPDVIYMDPMHPSRQKSALVKKEMQVLQNAFGSDEDVSELLHLAMIKTRGRVVVKWPQRLTPVLKPHASIEGKTVRFDIYIT